MTLNYNSLKPLESIESLYYSINAIISNDYWDNDLKLFDYKLSTEFDEDFQLIPEKGTPLYQQNITKINISIIDTSKYIINGYYWKIHNEIFDENHSGCEYDWLDVFESEVGLHILIQLFKNNEIQYDKNGNQNVYCDSLEDYIHYLNELQYE